MLYVPLMKNRQEEIRFLKKHNTIISDRIIPLIEVISEYYEPRYKVDEDSGKFVYEIKPGNKKRTRIKLESTAEDIITIDNLIDRVKGKRMFVDYFRFTAGEYSGNIDYQKVQLSLTNSRFFKQYKSRVLELCKYDNIIPVISIKAGFDMSQYDLIEFIRELKQNGCVIGIRLTSDLLEEYSDILESALTSEDFVLFDIREEDIDSQFMELDEFSSLNISATKVLLNSPRKRDLRNTAYEDSGITELINNNVAESYIDYGFQGYGDYAGLKDTLPQDAGSNGTGAAMSLLYDFRENGFHVYKNPDTSLGVRGYNKVIQDIDKDRLKLDSDNTCLGLKKIDSLDSTGAWSTWNGITLLRYIDQVNKMMV